MTRIKVVYFDFAVAAGGSIVVLQNTLRSLDREKYDPVVVTCLPTARAQELFGGLSVPIITYHQSVTYVQRIRFLSQPRFLPSGRRRLASYLFTLYSTIANSLPFLRLLFQIARLRPGLIHTHNGIDSMIIANVLRIPTVLHLHGPFGAESNLEARIVRSAGRCICVSQGLADMLLERGVDPSKLVVLANPSPVPKLEDKAVTIYRQIFAGESDQPLVAHVGRLLAWKGQLEFLRAFARVAKQSPAVKALVIGDDAEGLNRSYVDQLHRFVADEGLHERVFFTGHIGDIHNLVAAVDIVVHSSTEPEPFGLVVTEAMALGKPVVAASFGATAEIVDDGATGLLADPNDEVALSGAILKLVEDPQLRQRLGEEALLKAEREYSLRRYQSALENIYDEVVPG
jgi:glycosyltransferase involved in cell wall biosynthesis